MTVYQSMNQEKQTPLKGKVTETPTPNTISCQINPSSSSSFVAGSPVKLISGTSGQILVDLAGPTEPVFGFITYNLKLNKPIAGATVEVALSGSIMMMESAGDIERGNLVEIVTSGTLVQQYRGVNEIVGVCLHKVSGANKLARIFIRTSGALEEASSSSSSCRSSSSSSRSSSSSSSSSSCRSSSSSSSSRSSSSSSCSSSSCRSSSSSSSSRSSSSSSSSCRSSSSSSSSKSSSSSSSSCRSSSSSSCSSSSSSNSFPGM